MERTWEIVGISLGILGLLLLLGSAIAGYDGRWTLAFPLAVLGSLALWFSQRV